MAPRLETQARGDVVLRRFRLRPLLEPKFTEENRKQSGIIIWTANVHQRCIGFTPFSNTLWQVHAVKSQMSKL